jgi:hypothetical protein
MTETAEVIQIAQFRKKTTAPINTVEDEYFARRRKVKTLPEPQTDTGRNYRLRQKRRHDWWVADARREYWRTAHKMENAISHARRAGLPEGELHPGLAPLGCWGMVAKYREAIMAQLLTPAPTAREIEWKRAAFKAGDHEYTDVKPERIERAIADDVEFLRTHPTRRSGKQGMDPKKLEERRTWKAAFRARVTLYAEQNGIDKSELAWLGRIKHEHLAAFADRYGLSYEWLLEGSGTEGGETPTT